jgi:hypothetical protein
MMAKRSALSNTQTEPCAPYTIDSVPIPPVIANAARKLKDGVLNGKIWEVHDAAEPGLLKFLSAFNESDETAALNAVVGAVCCDTRLFDHPYVIALRHFLRENSALSDDLRNHWQIALLKSYAEHTLVGSYTVEISKIGQPVGRPMTLFGEIKQTDGSFPSEANRQQRAEARWLVELFEEVHQSLEIYQPAEQDRNIDWHDLKVTFESSPDSAAETVKTLAYDLEDFFTKFVSERGLQLKNEPDWKAIAMNGLSEAAKNNSPRHEVSCGLVAALDLLLFARSKEKVNSGLIHKTLECLRGDDYLGREAIDVIRHRVSIRLGLAPKQCRHTPAEPLRFYSSRLPNCPPQ